VADETAGQWGQVHTIDISVTGITPVNEERITAVSCASAGNCAATGNAGNATGDAQVFVADEVGGTWGPPQPAGCTAVLTATRRSSPTSPRRQEPGEPGREREANRAGRGQQGR
jgi:hypothetical protein